MVFSLTFVTSVRIVQFNIIILGQNKPVSVYLGLNKLKEITEVFSLFCK